MAIVNRTRSSAVSPKKSPPAVQTTDNAGNSPAEKASAPKETQEVPSQEATLKRPIVLVFLFLCFALVKDLLDSGEHSSSASEGHIPESMKPWLDLTITLLSVSIYVNLITRVSKKALFYSCLISYVGFFAVRCGFLMNSQHDSSPRWAAFQIHLRELLFKLTGRPLPSLFVWTVFRHCLVELWASVVMPVFFWGLANKISTIEEAKWMYPSFGLIAYAAHKLPGLQREYFAQFVGETPSGIRSWEFFRTFEGLVLCLLISALYWLISGGSVAHHTNHKVPESKLKSPGISLDKHYTRNFGVLLLANGIIYSLVEQTWRSKVKGELGIPLNSPVLSHATGGVAKVAATLLSVFVLQRYGWGVAANITPTLLLGWLLASVPLLGSLSASSYMAAFGYIWCSNAYYSLAYPCKQMVYMLMDEHAQGTFKAAFDLLIGRHTGVLVQQILAWKFGSLAGSTPYVEAILAVSALAMLNANLRLRIDMASLCIPSKVKDKSE